MRAESEGVNRNQNRGSGHPLALPHYGQEVIATICCGNNLLSGTSYRVDNDIAVTKSGLPFHRSYDDSTERVFPTLGSLVIVAARKSRRCRASQHRKCERESAPASPESKTLSRTALPQELFHEHDRSASNIRKWHA